MRSSNSASALPSTSIKSSSASTELCFVAALVEDRPFSTIGVTVALRDLDRAQSALPYRHSPKHPCSPRSSLCTSELQKGAQGIDSLLLRGYVGIQNSPSPQSRVEHERFEGGM